MPGWIINTLPRLHKALVKPAPPRALFHHGLLYTMLVVYGFAAPFTSAHAEPHWQNTVWLLADNKYKRQQHRSWQELNQQEKQRIYRRHQQFKQWTIEEQQRACSTYYERFGEEPPACRKLK